MRAMRISPKSDGGAPHAALWVMRPMRIERATKYDRAPQSGWVMAARLPRHSGDAAHVPQARDRYDRACLHPTE